MNYTKVESIPGKPWWIPNPKDWPELIFSLFNEEPILEFDPSCSEIKEETWMLIELNNYL